jgi:hypothetical protein
MLTLGSTGDGFSERGLKQHMTKLHKRLQATTTDVMPPKGVRTDVIGDAQGLIDDIKEVVDADWEYKEYVTTDFDDDGSVRGWFVRGRVYCCDWTARGKGYNHGTHSKKTGKPYRCTGYFVSVNSNKASAFYAPDSYESVSATQSRNRMAAINPAPVEPLDKEGVRVKAHNGVLYVDGQPSDLQAFIDGLRLAVRMS